MLVIVKGVRITWLEFVFGVECRIWYFCMSDASFLIMLNYYWNKTGIEGVISTDKQEMDIVTKVPEVSNVFHSFTIPIYLLNIFVNHPEIVHEN